MIHITSHIQTFLGEAWWPHTPNAWGVGGRRRGIQSHPQLHCEIRRQQHGLYNIPVSKTKQIPCSWPCGLYLEFRDILGNMGPLLKWKKQNPKSLDCSTIRLCAWLVVWSSCVSLCGISAWKNWGVRLLSFLPGRSLDSCPIVIQHVSLVLDSLGWVWPEAQLSEL